MCFNWYRLSVTIPPRVGDFDPTGATVVFERHDRRLRRGLGERRAAAGARGQRRPGRRRASTHRTASCSTQDAQPGQQLPDRSLRHQRPDLGVTAQLHLAARCDPRLLRRRSCGRERTGHRGRRSAWIGELDGLLPPVPRSNASPAASSSPKVRSGRGTAHCCSARPTRIRFTGGRRRAASPCSARTAATGHRHRPLSPARLQRPDLRPAGPAHDLPARQPAHHAGRAARQHHRPRRPVRRQAAQQPERPRLPLRRHAVLHRPAIRPARHVRRPQEGARVQRSVHGA